MGSQNNAPQGNKTGGANTPPPQPSEAEKAKLEAEAKAKAEAEAKAKLEAEARAKADEEAAAAKPEADGPPKRHAIKVLAETKGSATVTDGVEVWKHILADGPVKEAVAPSLRDLPEAVEGDTASMPQTIDVEIIELARSATHRVLSDGKRTWKEELPVEPKSKKP